MNKKTLSIFEKYFRYVNYLSTAQLYLKDNFFLEKPLQKEHVKERILGHWGTCPGLSFFYMHANYLITKTKARMLFIAGPGHGAPGVLSNLFAEGTMSEFYEEYSLDGKGAGNLMRNFSWPGGLPSHLYPGVPGSILEGGELGYSLSTAFGAVLDNPDLIAVCAVGDGESETGPLAAAWHSTKFLNAQKDGAVLPIVHVNGYKISGPTIYGTMSDDEFQHLFTGLGYQVRIVGADHEEMADAMQWAYDEIRKIQKEARNDKNPQLIKLHWPMIVARTPKGWSGVKELKGKKIEGNFPSHGIPLGNPQKDPEQMKALKEWLESYRIHELIDSKGAPKKEILEFVPKGDLRMGMNAHTFGGEMRKKIKIPKLERYEMKFQGKGCSDASNTEVGAKLIRDIIRDNPDNFRFMCPDETESNKLHAVFEVTKRAYTWPLQPHDVNMGPDGQVMEILSEHTLQGWLQGYLLTGRHGIFATYEAFATIVASMVDQYAKFLKQSMRIPWRKPVASLNYILTSLGWRQEHNGYSHQNPSFISNVVEKHGQFCSVYLPADANSLLVTLEDCFMRTNSINVIVSGKNPMPQWLTLDEARRQQQVGAGRWDFAHPGSKNPDVVFAAAGDHMTLETMAAITILKEVAPELKVRMVNISEITALGIGDESGICKINGKVFDYLFTPDKPVIFVFHGYPDVLKKLLWNHPQHNRFTILGYLEEGTTTTPFDMQVRNKTSRYHLVMNAVMEGAKTNKAVAKKAPKIIKMFEDKLTEHQKYIRKYGKDLEEIERWKWEK